jgi:hypothetical protein
VYRIRSGSDEYIDLAKDLSIVNRKLIRQKQIFTVMVGMMKDSGGSDLRFSVAPHTWTTKLAINRAFKQWRKLQSLTYKRTEGLRAPKWNDFKVYLDEVHTAGQTLKPSYNSTKLHQDGEWNYSTLVQPKLIDPDNDGGLEFDDDADSWDLHIVGPHTGSTTITTDSGKTFYQNVTRVGMINSWYHSRPVPVTTAPNNVPAGADPGETIYTDPLSNLFDIHDDDNEMASVIESENDQAPYDYNRVQGAEPGELQLVSFCDNSSGEPDIVTIPGFQAVCGLIKVTGTTDTDSILILDVQTEGERF